MRKWWKYTARDWARRRTERLQIWAANRLPRWLVYRATIRAGVHASTGPWSNQVIPELTLADALRRWEK